LPEPEKNKLLFPELLLFFHEPFVEATELTLVKFSYERYFEPGGVTVER